MIFFSRVGNGLRRLNIGAVTGTSEGESKVDPLVGISRGKKKKKLIFEANPKWTPCEGFFRALSFELSSTRELSEKKGSKLGMLY